MTLFLVLLALISVTRLIEMNISRRHRRELLERGAASAADPGFLGMVLLHMAILAGSLVEAVVFSRSAPVWLSLLASLAVLNASALRIWAIRSLGQHWNVRVINSTSLGVVQQGPYKYIRHPNYVAVFAELAFLLLVQGAWLTAVIGTGLHFLVLYRRIRHEEKVLMESADYQKAMAHKPRFIPDFLRTTTNAYPTGHS